MSVAVSGAVNLMSKSKLKDEIMNSTIKTRYQVDAVYVCQIHIGSNK